LSSRAQPRDLQFFPSNSFQSTHHRAFEASNVKTVAKDENSADDNMEHREGIEPSNTGFAVEKQLASSVTYRKLEILYGVEKTRWESAQWCENGFVAGGLTNSCLNPHR
jgi:hypothetical protein